MRITTHEVSYDTTVSENFGLGNFLLLTDYKKEYLCFKKTAALLLSLLTAESKLVALTSYFSQVKPAQPSVHS